MTIITLILSLYLFIGVIVAKAWVIDANQQGRIGKLGTFIILSLNWIPFVKYSNFPFFKKDIFIVFKHRKTGKLEEFHIKSRFIYDMRVIDLKYEIEEKRPELEYIKIYIKN